jgi:hypothetical protein
MIWHAVADAHFETGATGELLGRTSESSRCSRPMSAQKPKASSSSRSF